MSNRFLISLRKKFNENEKKRTLLPAIDESTIPEKKKKNIINSKNIEDDPSIYQYDEVYDSLDRESEGKNRLSVIFNDKTRSDSKKSDQKYKPKYMKHLLESAANRQMENERRRERKIQKERKEEESKGEFLDKDTYITDNHRKRLKELDINRQQSDDDEDSEKKNFNEFFSVAKSLQESMSKEERKTKKSGEIKEETDSSTSSEYDSNSESESESIIEGKEKESGKKKEVKRKRITIDDLKKKSERERIKGLMVLMEKKTVGKVYEEAVKKFKERQLKSIIKRNSFRRA
ncbi:hypothetical protein SNEBB_004161 [Seison nebaliae]|nr:hypothetical protein SNEBB_004161 [Seison nebaliae]